MRTINVDKKELIKKLKTNRKNHVKLFEETQAGYEMDVQDWFTKQLERLEDGYNFSTMFEGENPESHESDYNRIIGMLEMDTDKEVDLTTAEYTMYIEDKWSWKNDFSHLNSTYSKV